MTSPFLSSSQNVVGLGPVDKPTHMTEEEYTHTITTVRLAHKASTLLGDFHRTFLDTNLVSSEIGVLIREDVAKIAFDVWLRGCRESAVATVTPYPAVPSEAIGRYRYLRRYNRYGRFRAYGDMWGKQLNFYFEILPVPARKELESVFAKARLDRQPTPDVLYSHLKEMSDLYKKMGPTLSEHWKVFVNLETLGGYLPEVPEESFKTDIEDWITGDVHHESLNDHGDWTEEQFLHDFDAGMRDYLSSLPNLATANERVISLDEFLTDPGNWARSGASILGFRVPYVTKDGTHLSRKSKWATGLSRNPAYFRAMVKGQLVGSRQQRLKVIQKRETGKVRAVVNSDDLTYIRMSYISSWLESALSGLTSSTLFMSNAQSFEFWSEVAAETENSTTWKLPLDQSHFDWQQNVRMISLFFSLLRDLITANAPRAVQSDLLQCLSLVEDALLKIPSSVEFSDGTSIPYEKGVLSGWRWTALIDTVMNAGELYAARRLLSRMGFEDAVISFNAQGDDDRVVIGNAGYATALPQAYSLMNFEVNPSKFFLATDRDEYLRRVASGGSVSGYPARAVTAIMQRNPISRDPPAGKLRLREQVTSWSTLASRCAFTPQLAEHMLADLAGGNSLSKATVDSLLRTPASLGGLGFYPAAQETRGLSVTEGVAARSASIPAASLPGWSELRRGLPLTDGDLSRAAQTLLEMPKATFAMSEAEVSEVRVPRVYKPHGPGTAALSARRSPEVNHSLGDALLRNAIRDKNWDWIQNTYVLAEDRSLSQAIHTKLRRRVWLDWITDSLPFHPPVVWNWASDAVSVPHRQFSQYQFGCCLTYRHFSGYNTIRRSAVTAELNTRHYLSGLGYVLAR